VRIRRGKREEREGGKEGGGIYKKKKRNYSQSTWRPPEQLSFVLDASREREKKKEDKVEDWLKKGEGPPLIYRDRIFPQSSRRNMTIRGKGEGGKKKRKKEDMFRFLVLLDLPDT